MTAGAADRRACREPNRLHRRTQRLEHVLACLLGLLTAVAAGVALLVGGSAYASVAERARAESADRTEVSGVLLRDAVPLTRDGGSVTRSAPVRWTDRHGVERTATGPVAGYHRAGDTVPLWSADDGRLLPAPTTLDDATVAGVVFGALTGLAGGAAVCAIGGVVFAWTGRRFRRAWEQEWERVGPEWTAAGPQEGRR